MTSLYHKLVFYYKPDEITKDTNIIFTFTPPTQDPLTDKQNCAAWNVVEVRKSEPQDGKFTVEYHADFGFSTAQVVHSTPVAFTSAYRDDRTRARLSTRKPGQTTNLKPDCTWSTPTPLPVGSRSFQAINKTDTYQDIAVGTIVHRGDFIDLEPTFLFNVGSESIVTADFHPKLMMYSTMEYTQNSLMTAEVTASLYWQQDLSALQKETTYWSFKELLSGKYEVSPIEG
ncbi:hypothetical protein L218DRAFT_1008095 [Marasmius fiardii PR-910]|nr:hypothetical protein L218DRAFT_1008095 [Marasmius fiardii PR-910]